MTVHYSDDWLTIHLGDCRAVMAELEADSVQAVVTSPPYFGLRDYGLPAAEWPDGWVGTLGLEPDPFMYVEHMVEVFRALRRILRPDGMVWLNLGDTYAASPTSRTSGGTFEDERRGYVDRPPRVRPGTFKAKDRMLIPARVAIALQDDGWWVRDEVVWHKPNPMPSSVEDRTTPAHEMIYTLTKRARYWSDYDAIREGGVETRPQALTFARESKEAEVPGQRHKQHRTDRVKVPGGWDVTKGAGGHGAVHREGRTEATYGETDRRWPRGWAHGEDRGHDPQVGRYEIPDGYVREVPLGRNKRSVWTIATQPYPEAHFATFPEALVAPMIRASCPVGGLVLDPFGGSGTVALVAQRLGRRAVLIDLSDEYVGQMVKRIAGGRASGEGPAVDMPVPFATDGLWGEPESA